MKISDILAFKHNGLEGIEAKLNGNVVWKKESQSSGFIPIFSAGETSKDGFNITWNDLAGNWNVTSNNVYLAFDNNDKTSLTLDAGGTSTTKGAQIEIYMEFPRIIVPKTIIVKHSGKSAVDFSILLSADKSLYDAVYSFSKSSGLNEDNYDPNFNEDTIITLDSEVIATNGAKYLTIRWEENTNYTSDNSITRSLTTLQITEWEEV